MVTRLVIGAGIVCVLLGVARAADSGYEAQVRAYERLQQLRSNRERQELLEKMRQRQLLRFRTLQRAQLNNWRNTRTRQIVKQRAQLLRGYRLPRNPSSWRLPKVLRPTHVTTARLRLIGLSRAAFASARPTPGRSMSLSQRSLPGLRTSLFR